MDAVQVRYRSPSGDLQILTDAHNSFLNFAVQCGLAGLAALAAIVALGWSRSLPLRIMAEDRNVVRLGLGIAWLSAFAYQGLTGSCEDSRHLWVLFGLLIAANRIETGGTRHEMHPANSLANRSPGENPQ